MRHSDSIARSSVEPDRPLHSITGGLLAGLMAGVLLGLLLSPALRPAPALLLRVHSSRAIERLLEVTPRVWTGGEPQEPGFAELYERGVRTLISVDGARPNLEAAKPLGLRYVHIPIGYDDVPDSASRALLAAVRETDGAVFVHCHHGQHRGPAAAAVLCIELGSPPADTLRILEAAGTGAEYAGLWDAVRGHRSHGITAPVEALVEWDPSDTLAMSMARTSRLFDSLTRLQTAGPGLDESRRVATLLTEEFQESRRLFASAFDDAEFLRQFDEATAAARALQTDLTQTQLLNPAIRPHLDRLKATCVGCHRVWRK